MIDARSKRDIDALVAEHVMEIDGGVRHTNDYAVFEARPDDPVTGEWVSIRHYSTQISAAWEVVEKVERRGAHFMLESTGKKGANTWCAQFDPGEAVSADTAPLAICLSALMSVNALSPTEIQSLAMNTNHRA